MTIPQETTLHLDALSVGYGARTVIDGLSLTPFRGGEITALIGPNAAGKTTLLRALAGLQPARGALRLGDVDLLRLDGAAHAARVSYMPQALPQRVALTVFEATLSALRASPSARPDARTAHTLVGETLDALGIGALAFRSLDQLSGGQRQLASLAQSVVRQPSVLLLDEPTSALDLNYQFRVMHLVQSIVRARGIIAVVVLHDIALACRWCQRVVVLSNGRVVADSTPAEAITPDILARVYGVQARVEPCSRGTVHVMVDNVLGGDGAIGPSYPRSVAPPST